VSGGRPGFFLIGLAMLASGCAEELSTDVKETVAWVGGVELPDRFLAVRLELEPGVGGTLLLPGEEPTPVHADTIGPDSMRFVLAADGTEYVFDGVVSSGPTEVRGVFGPVGNADVRFPFRLVPVLHISHEQLVPFEGAYRFVDGRSIRVRAEDPGVLRVYVEGSETFHTLYPEGEGRFFQAAGLASPFPREAAVAIDANGMDHELWGKASRDSVRRVAVSIETDAMGVVVRIGSVDLRFLPSMPGEFKMGSVASPTEAIAAFGLDVDSLPGFEHPPHQVRLSHPALLGRTEVTNAQFSAFVVDEAYATTAERQGFGLVWNGEGFDRVAGASWRHPGREIRRDEPVTMVSWEDAAAFSDWLSRRTGRTVRLPTEAEWEYAARSGETGFFGFAGGLAELPRFAWYGANANGRPHPVAAKRPNAGGFYDMHGNVWEWCLDWYAPIAADSLTIDPVGTADGSTRVLRGGSWLNGPFDLRVGYRAHDAPELAEPHIGFRAALEAP
jgi:formylglycine-generating enzyme required for sulfatase activity